jgi:hypothetical protein
LARTKEEWTACTQKFGPVSKELAVQRKFQTVSPLHPVAAAVTERVRDGVLLVTTGPFVETVEQLGGYYILDLDSLDEAIALASRLPPAQKGRFEIHPIRDTDNLPLAKLGSERQPVFAFETGRD